MQVRDIARTTTRPQHDPNHRAAAGPGECDFRAEARTALSGRLTRLVLRYVDGGYNSRRIQAVLGRLSPDEYEYSCQRTHLNPRV